MVVHLVVGRVGPVGLDVDQDVDDLRAELEEALLDHAGDGVSLGHGQVRGDQDVEVHLEARANVAGAELVDGQHALGLDPKGQY